MSNCNLIPLGLQQEIDSADTVSGLGDVAAKMPEMANLSIGSGTGIKSVVQLISLFNDAVTRRLIVLLDSEEGVRLPEGATYLVLGSEGRGEQTLRTDQDNAIVYSDDLPHSERRKVEFFADRLVAALEEVGIPRCPGNIMANNPKWCHSVSGWKQLLSQWIKIPTPENILNFGTFQDLRALHGDETPVIQLRDHICTAAQCHGLFFPNMAAHVVRFPSPFTFLGRIRVEQNGIHKGMVDLKKSGIFAITTGSSLLALENGIIGGDTWSKLELLSKLDAFSNDDFETITKAFTFLVQLRLQKQLHELSSGSKPTNCVDPRLMADDELEQFRHALKGVNNFLWIFRNHYLLDFISM
ncbi:MAG: hypothetical protein GJV46_09715 [Geobacter sp.]|nr:hypothetical protein [Geobacter sp.]